MKYDKEKRSPDILLPFEQILCHPWRLSVSFHGLAGMICGQGSSLHTHVARELLIPRRER